MYDIITIGSATQDVFMEPEEARIEKDSKYESGQGVCFGLGSKIDVPKLRFKTGGSAVNSAITFARQGLRVAALCSIGNDIYGKLIIERLQESGVSTSLIFKNKDYFTAYSIILVTHNMRTILAHRGASEHLCCGTSIPYEKLKSSKWFYITNLGGESYKIFKPIVEFAHKNNIKVALNPGKAQLRRKKELKALINKIDILILNQEEASILTGISYNNEKGIFNKVDEWTRGFVVMTKGKRGFVACDNEHQLKGSALKEPRYTDRTGAGDAFGSGFVSGIINGTTAEEAFQLASANATSTLGEWGANHGLLEKNDDIYKFGRLEISKKKCVNENEK